MIHIYHNNIIIKYPEDYSHMDTAFQTLQGLYSRRDELTPTELEDANHVAKRIINYILRMQKNCTVSFVPVFIFLRSLFSDEQLEVLFWGRKQCNCCCQHTKNRPLAYNSNENDPNIGNPSLCRCTCRDHLIYIRMSHFFDHTEWEQDLEFSVRVNYHSPADAITANLTRIKITTEALVVYSSDDEENSEYDSYYDDYDHELVDHNDEYESSDEESSVEDNPVSNI